MNVKETVAMVLVRQMLENDIQILTEKSTTLPDDVQNEEGTQNEKLSAFIRQCALIKGELKRGDRLQAR